MMSQGLDDGGRPILVGHGYSPQAENDRLRAGLRRSLHFTNRIASTLIDTKVLGYGNPAHIQGPDIVSLLNGVLQRWDLRWRTIDRIAGPSEAASAPLDLAQIEHAVWRSVTLDRLTPAEGTAALKAFDAGSYDLISLGDTEEDERRIVCVRAGHYRRRQL